MPLAEAKRELIGPRRWTDVLYLHLSSYFQVLPPSGPRRPRLPLPARHRVRTADQAAGGRQVRDRHQPLPDGLRLRLRHLVRTRPLPVPSACTRGAPSTTSPPASRWSSATSWPRTRATCRASPRWPDWLQQAAPDAPMDMIRASIDRVSPTTACSAACVAALDDDGPGRRVRPQPPWQGYGFRWMDEELPKLRPLVGLPGLAGDPSPGSRRSGALFEAVRDDPTIRKVVLTRSRRVDLDGENVTVLPLDTPGGAGRAGPLPRDPARPDAARDGRRPAARSPAPLRAPRQRPARGARPARAGPARLGRVQGPRQRLPPAERHGRGRPCRRPGQGRGHACSTCSALADRPAAARPRDAPPRALPVDLRRRSRSCGTGSAAGGWSCCWPRPGRSRPRSRTASGSGSRVVPARTTPSSASARARSTARGA